MGMLDDAIREHLELRRLKGADPAEVAREEHDALGQVRRESEPIGTSAVDADEQGEPFEDDELDRVEARPAGETVGQETLEINMEAELHGVNDHDGKDSSKSEARAKVAPVGHPAHTQSDARDSLEWEMPGDRDAKEVAKEEQDGADHPEPDDVLQETPDFLRETPEHERLWFEQRPPRDFDFNE